MDKEHLVDMIMDFYIHENKKSQSMKSYLDLRSYFQQYNLEQLRSISLEYIL